LSRQVLCYTDAQNAETAAASSSIISRRRRDAICRASNDFAILEISFCALGLKYMTGSRISFIAFRIESHAARAELPAHPQRHRAKRCDLAER